MRSESTTFVRMMFQCELLVRGLDLCLARFPVDAQPLVIVVRDTNRGVVMQHIPENEHCTHGETFDPLIYVQSPL